MVSFGVTKGDVVMKVLGDWTQEDYVVAFKRENNVVWVCENEDRLYPFLSGLLGVWVVSSYLDGEFLIALDQAQIQDGYVPDEYPIKITYSQQELLQIQKLFDQ